MRKMFAKIKNRVDRFLKEQSGDLGAAAWILGIIVICVTVVLAIRAIAPDTATDLWNTIWNWVQDQFNFS